jgi:hypothetical protein
MFRLRLLRIMLIEGRRWVPGAELQADAVAAAEMICAGSACLVHDADMPRLIAALPAQGLQRQAARAA